MNFTTRQIEFVAAAAVMLVASGCSTTLVGSRVPTSPSGELGGIPVNMTKPQFGVTYTPGATPDDEPTATITIAYVADFDHRYVLNVSPSWLTSSGFDVSLGPEGQLVSVNSTGTSNAVAAIQTVAKIAKTVAGVGALDKATPAYDKLAKTVAELTDSAVSSEPPLSCVEENGYSAKLDKRAQLTAPLKNAQSQLAARLKLAGAVPDRNEFHYFNDDELRLLKTARCELEKVDSKTKDGLIAKKDEAIKNLAGKKNEAAVLQLTNSAIDAEDQKARVASLVRLRLLARSTNDPATLTVAAATAAIAGRKPAPELTLAKGLVEISRDDWRRRRILSVQREITAREWRLTQLGCGVPSVVSTVPPASPSDCATAASALDTAREELAESLGKLTDQRLAARLGKQLTAQAAGAKDVEPLVFQRLRTARGLAVTDLENAKAAAVKTAAPPAPVTLKKEAVPMLNASGQAKSDGDWVLEKVVEGLAADSNDLPALVVVIDKGR